MRKSVTGENLAPGDQYNKNRFFHDAMMNQPSYSIEESYEYRHDSGSKTSLNESSNIVVNDVNDLQSRNYSRVYHNQQVHSDQVPKIGNFGSYRNDRDSKESFKRD
jgi:hypothetical protein